MKNQALKNGDVEEVCTGRDKLRVAKRRLRDLSVRGGRILEHLERECNRPGLCDIVYLAYAQCLCSVVVSGLFATTEYARAFDGREGSTWFGVTYGTISLAQAFICMIRLSQCGGISM